jgi:hypothetical protein
MRKLLIISLLCITTSAYTQNVVGSWKRVSSVMEYADGKADDLQKNMSRVYPCSKDIKYVFEKTGKHFMILPKGCEDIPNIPADWKMVGNQFNISQKAGKESMSTSYELSFSGNTMTMSHNYTDAEQVSKVKIKRIVLKYERL